MNGSWLLLFPANGSGRALLKRFCLRSCCKTSSTSHPTSNFVSTTMAASSSASSASVEAPVCPVHTETSIPLNETLNDAWIDNCADELPISWGREHLSSAAAVCLLALSMVVAGSGSLVVLRLVRQLRAIHLFVGSGKNTVCDLFSYPINFFITT
ncbi:unnamed protein product [Protopolystoma xenopodis]|uniref:Uncharacterized protein n=1 Tax=Protopolystoma xenopodis TaxID=117903 RepID=A0A448WQB5_9PLAT|nr:unnamed protein product [Protopolystoma xenopodis]